jgi:hypothetical protein
MDLDGSTCPASFTTVPGGTFSTAPYTYRWNSWPFARNDRIESCSSLERRGPIHRPCMVPFPRSSAKDTNLTSLLACHQTAPAALPRDHLDLPSKRTAGAERSSIPRAVLLYVQPRVVGEQT